MNQYLLKRILYIVSFSVSFSEKFNFLMSVILVVVVNSFASQKVAVIRFPEHKKFPTIVWTIFQYLPTFDWTYTASWGTATRKEYPSERSTIHLKLATLPLLNHSRIETCSAATGDDGSNVVYLTKSIRLDKWGLKLLVAIWIEFLCSKNPVWCLPNSVNFLSSRILSLPPVTTSFT